MQTIFILHGLGGHPDENWFPWLKAELEANALRVIVPGFPSADHPELAAWLERMDDYREEIDGETTLVGHSLGAAFALRLIERRECSIASCFLVAPVWGVMGTAFDSLMTTFTDAPYD